MAFTSSDSFIRGDDNGRGIIIKRDKLLGRCGIVVVDKAGSGDGFDIEYGFLIGTSSMDIDRIC